MTLIAIEDRKISANRRSFSETGKNDEKKSQIFLLTSMGYVSVAGISFRLHFLVIELGGN
jgi:hypothetical protein